MIVNGIGRHSDLVVPGRVEFDCASADWPERFFAGSLNVRILRYPDEFLRHGLRLSMDALDSGVFEPAFTIPHSQMLSNKLTPVPHNRDRGNAQVWRASLSANNLSLVCWVLRRIGSQLKQQIELISQVGMRTELGADTSRDWPAIVTMHGQWRAR